MYEKEKKDNSDLVSNSSMTFQIIINFMKISNFKSLAFKKGKRSFFEMVLTNWQIRSGMQICKNNLVTKNNFGSFFFKEIVYA